MKLDLETLKYVKFAFELHSDHSCDTNGYKSLIDLINKTENEQLSIQGVSQQSELSFLEGYEIKVYESEYVDKPQLLIPKGLVKKDCA